MKKNSLLIATFFLGAFLYSPCFAQNEQGTTFEKITNESADFITRPNIYVGKDFGHIPTWAQYMGIDASKDGKSFAYVSKNGMKWNIFVRSTDGSSALQRTQRNHIYAFSYSPNSENICFSEYSDNKYHLFITSAKQGTSVQQISPSNCSDFAPRYSTDGKRIFFERWDGANFTVWSYNLETQKSENHGHGECPYPINDEEYICTRLNDAGFSTIMRVNYVKGTEKEVYKSLNSHFTTPSMSPDGKWILCVSAVKVKGSFFVPDKYQLDLFVMPSDGSAAPTQLTFDRGNDYSPVWSADGKYIYYISQRGNNSGTYNIWKMNFQTQEETVKEYGSDNPNNNNKTSNGKKKKLPKKVG